MASIHKRPASKFWHAAWRGGDGKLHLRSTKQTERSKALSIALEWERVDKKTTKGGMAEAQVRQVINDILERIGEPTIPVPSVKAWFNEWIDENKSSKSGGTAERYEGVVTDFLSYLATRSEKSLLSLGPRDVQGYLSKRLKQGVSATTAILDIKIIRAALNRARKQGLIQNNPAESVDLPKRKSFVRGLFTPAELGSLLQQASGTEWETIIMFGIFTGARLGDCTKMKWADVDLVNGTLKYFESKNQRELQLPLHPELQKHLKELASKYKLEKCIAPHMASLGPGGRHGLSEGFKRIVVKAGLDLQTVEGTGMRNLSKRTFHALRHTFTSALANAEVPQELRMKLTGHRSEAVHKGYTHLEMRTLKRALDKLPNVTTENAKP